MKLFIVPVAACALAMGGCASNYGGEGALGGAGVGAIIGAASGGNVARSAAIGAGVGAVAGSLIKKNGRCYRVDRDGREYRVRC